jgi:hypothetical protein
MSPPDNINRRLVGDGGTRRDDRVDEMYAYLAIDPDDNCEGIVGASINGTMMALVGADKRRMLSYVHIAAEIGQASNIRIELVKFSTREHVEWIEPNDERI